MVEPILSPADVDDFVIIKAVGFANKIQRLMVREVLRGEDLPLLEWRILFAIARFGDCHLAMISEKSALDPAHASRAAGALEDRGLIIRISDPADNRRKLLRHTQEGRAVFDRIWPNARNLIKQITDELSAEEFQKFKNLLDQVNDIASPMLNGNASKVEDLSAA